MTENKSNKLLVITGGTKGIGRAVLTKFMEQGFDIVTCSRDMQALDALQQECGLAFPGQNIHVIKADLSIKEEVQHFASRVIAMGQAVEVLVNNAGVFRPGLIHEEEEGALELMINTNLYSAYYLTRALVSGMKEQNRGDIYNICSVASIKAYPNGGSYGISKFALLGLTKGLRDELKTYGIRVSAVLPGATYTASWEGVDLPELRFIKAADIADAIWGAYSLSRQTVVEEILIRPQLGDI